MRSNIAGFERKASKRSNAGRTSGALSASIETSNPIMTLAPRLRSSPHPRADSILPGRPISHQFAPAKHVVPHVRAKGYGNTSTALVRTKSEQLEGNANNNKDEDGAFNNF